MTSIRRSHIVLVGLLAASSVVVAAPEGVWRCSGFPKGGQPFEVHFEFTAGSRVSRVSEAGERGSTSPVQVLQSQDTELVAWADAESGFEYRGRFSAARIDGALSSGSDDDVGGDFQCEPDAQFSVSRQDTEFEAERFLPPGAREGIVEAEPEPESKPKPTPKSMVAPAYPIEAMDEELEGQVVVCFYVDRQGRILEPLVMESSHEIFEAPVLKALSRSAYRPAEDDGRPARTHVCRTYKFWLD